MRRIDPRIIHRRPELSQHFLRDAGVARSIVRRLTCPPGAVVVEAGAGDGMLTEALAGAGLRVVAVEQDARLHRRLHDRFAGVPRVTCRHADFRTFPLPTRPYCVVSNVPYAITAALVRKLLHAARPPDEALLIVQREAAEKFAGTPRETLFSLLRKPWFDVGIAAALSRRDFVPPPRVASSLLRIRRRETPLVDTSGAAAYRTFVRATFARGELGASRALRPYVTARQLRRLGDDLGFTRGCRASHLTFEQWLGVFRFVEHECLGHDPTSTVLTAA